MSTASETSPPQPPTSNGIPTSDTPTNPPSTANPTFPSLPPDILTAPTRKYLYLAGIGVTHSVAYGMHNHIATHLSLPYTFHNAECPSIDSVMALFRAASFAGGVVTMPYKKAIMPHLDGLDDLAATLGAVNNVYLDKDGKLRGTNTDWRGVKGCLVHADEEIGGEDREREKVALIVGAGGASRAAVYALGLELGCRVIYIINRDEREVRELLEDTQAYGKVGTKGPEVIHVQSLQQAKGIQEKPYYIVGTVPDLEPKTEQELEARAILEEFLTKEGEAGILLDMCFKPRRTRMIKLGEKHGWKTVEGTWIIGHQVEEQWRLWAGEDASRKIPKEEAWQVLKRAAEESPAINF